MTLAGGLGEQKETEPQQKTEGRSEVTWLCGDTLT